VTIERLTSGDGARLRAIRLRALEDAPDAFASTFDDAASRSPEDWDRQLQQLPTFVARTADSDVGLVRAAPHTAFQDAAYVISMWVAPEVRRQGIGAALLDAIVEWARTQGLRRLFLDVGEANAPALALYTHKGFAPTGHSDTLPPPRTHLRELQLVMRL
jgi:GNAT superfamily N-acetyltransferase